VINNSEVKALTRNANEIRDFTMIAKQNLEPIFETKNWQMMNKTETNLSLFK